jgi:GT2 family glycosyltransferase
MLQWSIVICTLNRFAVLKDALQTVVKQTRPPKQIVVVDSSPDWEKCRAEVLRDLGARHPNMDWIYVGSSIRSLTTQRNIGLGLSSGDVTFFFDDDSFPYPDCAEQILAVYERDTAQVIGGVSAMLSPSPPTTLQIDNSTSDNRRYRVAELLASPWDQHKLFIPYDSHYYARSTDWLGMGTYVAPEVLFHGCRMTFRTHAVREAGGFNEILTRHCFGEDIDISYRVSRKHQLVVATKAWLFHLLAPSARAKKSIQCTLVIVNAVALHLFNVPPSRKRQVTVYLFAFRRLGYELLRDCLKPWRGFPNARGALRAMRVIGEIRAWSRTTLIANYPGVQLRLLQEIHG